MQGAGWYQQSHARHAAEVWLEGNLRPILLGVSRLLDGRDLGLLLHGHVVREDLHTRFP